MKKYIQLTAGRGPVECARCVALVARELLKDFQDAELVESEPHNTEPDCYMSMLFLAETDAVKELEWAGTILWRATSNRYRPGYPRKNWFVGVEFIEPITLPKVSDKDIVYETMRSGGHGRMSIKWRQRYAPLIFLPGFQSNAVPGVLSPKTGRQPATCFLSNCSVHKTLPQ